MASWIKSFYKSRIALSILMFLLGVIVVFGIRAATYSPPKKIHYHANFAVYINGQREAFNALNYYEEEAAMTCSAANTQDIETLPMSRVHMHNNVNDVVHVEDSRVTWGNFFTVLGWNVGGKYIATRDTLYQNNDTAKVTYILNGKKVDNIANLTIGDQDKLLVNYGDQNSDQIGKEYSGIKNNALKADQTKDPAGCGGSQDGSVRMMDRMRHMF